MKRSIINKLSQLSEELKGYVGALNYRYMNLCVKAEEASMLPIQVPIEDELKNIEDVGFVGKKDGDDYSIYIVPKIQDDLRDIAKSVKVAHPEFIQEIVKETVDPGDGSGNQEVSYLKLTMPEVNDDRHDVLTQAVDTFYKMCKAQMEKAKAEADVQFAALSADISPLEVDNMKQAVDEVNDMWINKREQLHDEKLKEIEDAYNQWLTHQQTTARQQQEEAAAHDQNVGTSMKMTSENDE